MELELIHKRTAGIPYMSLAEAREISTLILENQLCNILELGFCNGVSTCYFAGMLDTLGRGKVTTIDLESARDEKPGIESLLNDLGLKKYVTIFYEPTSYTWRLMLMLEEQPKPQFDFCYIDGAHNWFTDGFAFFLVDKLLRPGGWIVFDDVDWTYATSPNLKHTALVKNMPLAEKTTAQIRKVYELLVKPHRQYDGFMVKNGRAFARKKPDSSDKTPGTVRQEIIYQKEYMGLGAVVYRILKKIIPS
jgi:predicted O-methyltransferase YrrM